jgi:LmbE family N-acetylglucosaminyl deacetylase
VARFTIGDGDDRGRAAALHAQRQQAAAGEHLVVVSPHPDDEVLACGGLLALHAQRGGAAAIVAVTDGEASHQHDAAWPARRLASARRVERRRGLARLGLAAGSVTRLGLPDSAVASHCAALQRGLRQVLRPGDCVVSPWRLDGHPDHDATGDETARVCADLGCRLIEAPVWMWHWSAPADARVPWHRLGALALPADAMARKAAALAEHTTQLVARGDDPPVLGPAICARAAWGVEYFLV